MTDTQETVRNRHSDESFCKAFNPPGTAAEIAAKLGVTVNSVYTRKASLEKAGVKFPDFVRATRKSKSIDANKLSALMQATN